MRCKKCGEELPERARFCLICGAPTEGVPEPKRLEEPLDPLAAGAVPLVPVAPPPRAYSLDPRIRRAAARGDRRSTLPSIRPQEPVVGKPEPEPEEKKAEKVEKTTPAPEPETKKPEKDERPEATEETPDTEAAEVTEVTQPLDLKKEKPEKDVEREQAPETESEPAADDAATEAAPTPADEDASESDAAPAEPEPESAPAAEKAAAAAKSAAHGASTLVKGVGSHLASAGRQLRNGGRMIASGFEGSHVPALAVVAGVLVVLALVGVVLVGLGTSWLGPFAPRGEEPPVVQPPSDGSIPPLEADDEEAEAEEDDELVVRDALADYSWTELSRIAELIADASSDEEGIAVANEYNLCGKDGSLDDSQTKDLELGSGTTVPVAIAGFRADERADGEGVAGITFVAREPMATEAYNSSGAITSWEDCSLRSWMNDSLLDELPEDLAERVVPVTKLTNVPSGGSQCETTDSLWLLSRSEMGGVTSGGMASEGDQYRLFSDAGVDWQASSFLAISDDYWWQRGPGSDTRWQQTVGPDGNMSTGRTPSYEFGVVAGFCL